MFVLNHETKLVSKEFSEAEMSELSIAQTGIGMESKSLVVFEHIHPVVICFFNGHATMYLYEGRAKNKREKVFCPILKINPFFLRCVGGTNFLFKFLEPSLYYYLHNNRDFATAATKKEALLLLPPM